MVIRVMSFCVPAACANKTNWQQQALTVISHTRLMASLGPVIFRRAGLTAPFSLFRFPNSDPRLRPLCKGSPFSACTKSQVPFAKVESHAWDRTLHVGWFLEASWLQCHQCLPPWTPSDTAGQVLQSQRHDSPKKHHARKREGRHAF